MSIQLNYVIINSFWKKKDEQLLLSAKILTFFKKKSRYIFLKKFDLRLFFLKKNLALFKIFGRVLKLILCIFVRISLEWQLVKDFACTFIPLIPKMLVLTKVSDLWVILLIMGIECYLGVSISFCEGEANLWWDNYS
jgi:hypothetical protein